MASTATYEILATCTSFWYVPLSDIPRSVGELIRERRQARGWNQIELAKRLGISREYLSRWENDKHGPGPEYAKALARELGGEAAEYRSLGSEPRRLRGLVEDLALRVERLEKWADECHGDATS
jgi:transcriptional regulator with XRE-family HTH domain